MCEVLEKSSGKHPNVCVMFKEFAENNPFLTAAVFKDVSISYQELDQKSDKVSFMLKENGVKTGDIVALYLKRSIDMIIGILGILKAGAAFLPIDPDFPPDRILYMLEDSSAKVVLANDYFEENRINTIITKVLLLEAAYKEENVKVADIEIKASDMAYVIYTSGSTGNPKGVVIEHKAVVNLIEGITDRIDFSKGKTIIALTTISFDIFVLETIIPLVKGVTIIIADESAQKNPKILKDEIINNNVDMLQMTPSRLQQLINYDNDLSCLQNLKEIMIGGEALQAAVMQKIKCSTKARIYNMYGPTEATVWATVSELTDKDSIDIGKPIKNTQIYIVDENNCPVQDGQQGELCIGGCGLARGYWNRPEQTAEKFIDVPFCNSGKIYKTGDLARILPDGNIICLGRTDNQVKIRGHRVELGEIEAALLNFQKIKQAAVSIHVGMDNLNYLCAYYTADEKINPDILRDFLKKSLPDYMIPAYFLRLEKIPQTPNGKTDRAALPDPLELLAGGESGTACGRKPSDDCKASKVMEMIYDNIDAGLSIDDICIDSRLEDIGVNSISFIRIITEIEREFEFEFENEYLEVGKFATVNSILEYINNRTQNMPV